MRRFTHVGLIAVLVLVLAQITTPPPRVWGQSVASLVLTVEQATPIQLYASPTLSNPTSRTLGTGNRFLWNGTRTIADGRQWFQIVLPPSETFWISPDDGALGLADPTGITSDVDRSAIVQTPNYSMTLYETPGRSSRVVARLDPYTRLLVQDGPVVTDLYTWWPVQIYEGMARGWVVDTGRELTLIRGLNIYGYQVCDNFDLKRFGAVGYDSVISTFPSIIGTSETVVCFASTKLRGDTTPIVVLLTRSTNTQQPFDVLRLIEPQGQVWRVTFQQATEPFARTSRLSLHDLAGDGKPMLYWAVRRDGTGGVMVANLLRYNPGGIASILSGEFYKGTQQVGVDGITFIEAHYLPDEPNCCPTGMRRVSYQWQIDRFALIADEVLPAPYTIQTRR